MSLEKIEQMLRQRIGLHAQSVGRSAISSAVGRRMATCNIGSIHEYFKHLNFSCDEVSELIETVVIPETWFFRDGRPFEVLKEVVTKFLAARPGQKLRALSVPCATGEEPYSIAMTLLEAGAAANQIQVDAIDISRRALSFAQAGSYGSHSFRGEQDAGVLERYFHRDGTRYQICEHVRNLVNFSHGNLLDPAFAACSGTYDVIFCRNLMIYFDEQAKQTAFRTLAQALADHGLLFVGHAECGTVPPAWFHSAGHSFGFAFRKGAGNETSQAPKKRPLLSRKRSRTLTRLLPKRRAPAAPTPQRPDGDPLELARQLADLGRLSEAREICEAHLRQPERRADAYFLLGTIRAAEKDYDGALDALRRTVYLQPKHYEALVQMALLLEQQGDQVGAARMRGRAERALLSQPSDDSR